MKLITRAIIGVGYLVSGSVLYSAFEKQRSLFLQLLASNGTTAESWKELFSRPYAWLPLLIALVMIASGVYLCSSCAIEASPVHEKALTK